MLPLHGIKVIEVAQNMAGPCTGQILRYTSNSGVSHAHRSFRELKEAGGYRNPAVTNRKGSSE